MEGALGEPEGDEVDVGGLLPLLPSPFPGGRGGGPVLFEALVGIEEGGIEPVMFEALVGIEDGMRLVDVLFVVERGVGSTVTVNVEYAKLVTSALAGS